jgi:hypothetical protein
MLIAAVRLTAHPGVTHDRCIAIDAGQFMSTYFSNSNRRGRALLQFWSRFHGRSPTLIEAFARQPAAYWIGNVVLAGVVAYYAYSVRDAFSYGMMGLVAGAWLRDIARMLQFLREWPHIGRVLDWDAVERELQRPLGDA